MEAKRKNEIREKLQKLIGKPWLYRGREVRVQGFSVEEDEIRIYNGGNTIIFPPEKVDEELNEFMPMDNLPARNSEETKAMVAAQADTGDMDQAEKILMDNLNKLQEDDKYLEQAKEINSTVKTLLDIKKTKLKMMSEIRKAKRLTGEL